MTNIEKYELVNRLKDMYKNLERQKWNFSINPDDVVNNINGIYAYIIHLSKTLESVIESCCDDNTDNRGDVIKDVQVKIDDAVNALKNIDDDRRGQWLSYFAGSIEAEMGFASLGELYVIIADRIKSGGW